MGGFLTLLMALPWYQWKSIPGFIDYFLLGEHFLRFVDPSGRGINMFPKQQPLGIIGCFLSVHCLGPCTLGRLKEA